MTHGNWPHLHLGSHEEEEDTDPCPWPGLGVTSLNLHNRPMKYRTYNDAHFINEATEI